MESKRKIDRIIRCVNGNKCLYRQLNRIKAAEAVLTRGARFMAKEEPEKIDLMEMINSSKKHAKHHHHHR